MPNSYLQLKITPPRRGLMWRSGDQTRAALVLMVEGLRDMGLEPVPLSVLLAAGGDEP